MILPDSEIQKAIADGRLVIQPEPDVAAYDTNSVDLRLDGDFFVWDLQALNDITLRIGAKLGLEPKRVYLHAGTRQAVNAIGRDSKQDALEMTDLPQHFRRLKPCEIEDCLCIYKDQLLKKTRGRSSPCLTGGTSHRGARTRRSR